MDLPNCDVSNPLFEQTSNSPHGVNGVVAFGPFDDSQHPVGESDPQPLHAVEEPVYHCFIDLE